MAAQSLDFTDLEPFVKEWGLPTTHDRLVKRLNSSFEDLQSFHAAMSPRLDGIIEFLNQFPLDAIPEDYQALARTTLAMCEVDDAVSKWGAPTSPLAASPLRFTAKKSFYDNRPQESGIE
jgi:hypothetical protein